MNRFLNLFRSFREASAARIEAESELRVLRAKVEELQARVIEAQAQTLDYARRIADFSAQIAFGRKVFHDVPDIQGGLAAPKPIESQYPRPRDAQRKAFEEFSAELAELQASNSQGHRNQ